MDMPEKIPFFSLSRKKEISGDAMSFEEIRKALAESEGKDEEKIATEMGEWLSKSTKMLEVHQKVVTDLFKALEMSGVSKSDGDSIMATFCASGMAYLGQWFALIDAPDAEVRKSFQFALDNVKRAFEVSMRVREEATRKGKGEN